MFSFHVSNKKFHIEWPAIKQLSIQQCIEFINIPMVNILESQFAKLDLKDFFLGSVNKEL